YVDQRRANIKIHEARRAIDAANKALAERLPKIDGKEPSDSDFSDAQGALDTLKKQVDASRDFGKQDPKFAAYIGETDGKTAKAQKTIDDKKTQLAVEHARSALSSARDALKGALADLAKGASDTQFHAADKALAEVNKRLEEGKALEVQKAYQTDADK